jgi:hypothetical protein
VLQFPLRQPRRSQTAALHADGAEDYVRSILAVQQGDVAAGSLSDLVIQELRLHGFNPHVHQAQVSAAPAPPPALAPERVNVVYPGDGSLAGGDPPAWVAVKNMALVAFAAMATVMAATANSSIGLLAAYGCTALLLMVAVAVADRTRFDAAGAQVEMVTQLLRPAAAPITPPRDPAAFGLEPNEVVEHWDAAHAGTNAGYPIAGAAPLHVT